LPVKIKGGSSAGLRTALGSSFHDQKLELKQAEALGRRARASGLADHRDRFSDTRSQIDELVAQYSRELRTRR
jgi:hypothetical protein